jgi:hypothetical protein
VDSENVYFGEWGGPVYKVPINGGTVVSVGGYIGSDFLAIDATYIYETAGTEIKRMAKASGIFGTVASGLQQPWGVAVDSAGVYWTDEVTTVPGNGKIGMAPKQNVTPTPTPSPTSSPAATPGLVGNVATRLPVGAGENVLIEGFIVQGQPGSAKKMMVRAIGPSLGQFGVSDFLANPTLEIRDASNAVVASNDDWRTTQPGGVITGDQFAAISASQLAPSSDLESAIIADLVPGSYTAVVRGVGNTVGTGLVDAYDLGPTSPCRLANIATRGLIQSGDKLMIAGFIVLNGPAKVVIRATGPSLLAFGIDNALSDTTLQLRDQNGSVVMENDDWKTNQQFELQDAGLQPSSDLEAALITTIQPGQYTAQVRGKGDTAGIGVVEVYFLP